jgi:hypothetical protein
MILRRGQVNGRTIFEKLEVSVVAELNRAAALAVLGLSAQASSLDVVRAYRRLAKLTHPDVAGPSLDVRNRFAAITDAYHALSAAPPVPPSTPAPAAAPAPAGRTTQPRPAPPAWAVEPPIVAGPVTITPIPRPPRRPR